MPNCALCGLEIQEVTNHHLIPQSVHRKERNRNKRKYTNEELDNKVPMCEPCHSRIHSKFDDKELAQKINTIELLRGEMDVWIKWRRSHSHITFSPSRQER
jgi:predicted restriction endonuclease